MLSSTFSLVVIVVILLPLTICNIYGTLAFQLGAKSSSSSAPASATQVPLMLLMTNNDGSNSNDDDDLSSSTTTMDDIATAAVKRNLEKEYPPMILDPCLEAADFLSYSVNEPVGTNNNGFIVRREGSPTMEELTDANLYRIVVRNSTVTDLEVNTLVWKCLGYRFDEHDTVWRAGDAVFPKWKDKFPLPIDLINMQRIYTKDVDGVILKNNQQLAKSIPHKNKQYVKPILKPLGFNGYKLSELTPNLTRRAQCVNWLLYYREELFGYTLEELREKRRLKLQQQEQEQEKPNKNQ